MNELKLVPLPVARSDIWKKIGFIINDSGVILDKKKYSVERVRVQMLIVEIHQIKIHIYNSV